MVKILYILQIKSNIQLLYSQSTQKAIAADASDCQVLVPSALMYKCHWRTNSWCIRLLSKHFWTIWYSAQHRSTSGLLLLLRGLKLCRLMFGWEQDAQCQTALAARSVITVGRCPILALCKVISWHSATLLLALLLNLKSQYPGANLKLLSLSLWEWNDVKKWLSDRVSLPALEIHWSCNFCGKVTKQAITSDQVHKQQPVSVALHLSVYHSEIQEVDATEKTTTKKHPFLRSEAKQNSSPASTKPPTFT